MLAIAIHSQRSDAEGCAMMDSGFVGEELVGCLFESCDVVEFGELHAAEQERRI